MKTDCDFYDPEISQGNTLPTPLNKDHNYFSVPVDYSHSRTAWKSNHDYGADVTAGRKEKAHNEVTKDWISLSDVRTQGKPRSDVTSDRKSRSDVISARIPSTDSKVSIMTCCDVTDCGNTPCDARKSGKSLHDVRKTGKSFAELKYSRNISSLPESGQKESATETFEIFSDAKDATSPYSMLIDEEVIGSLLSQTKAAMEPPRPSSRMKLDSRYRTNSSDSAFSEDSLLEDEDAKLETLISQFIFNPTNFTDQNVTTDDDVDVDALDVKDLFSSAAMFAPDLEEPGFVAATERESGLGSSENSICSDNRDSSPAKRHTTPLLKKNDSISSISSSSSSSSSSASPSSSSSSSSSSASLSLSSLSLDALSSTVAASSLTAQRLDDLHLASMSAGENEALAEQTGFSDNSSNNNSSSSSNPVTILWQARDHGRCALGPQVESASSSSLVKPSKGDNSDNQGDDSTGFITLPTAHLATTKTTTTIKNTISHSSSNNNSNNNNNNNINNNNDDDDDKDSYDFLLTHLRNGFQQPFEIREDNSDLLLDEPDFVDFPFSTDTQNCRPNPPDTSLFTERVMESNTASQTAGSLVAVHSYESDVAKAKQIKPAFLLERPEEEVEVMEGEEDGGKIPDESLATAVLYMAKPPSIETPELSLKDVDYFNDYFEVDPKRDQVEECYNEAGSAPHSPFTDWFSIDENRIESDMIDSVLTSGLNLTNVCESPEAKHRKSDQPEIVQLTPDSTSTAQTFQADTSQNINNPPHHTRNSGEIPKSVRLLCSVKKCTSSKRPVHTLNFIKKVPIRKKSSSPHNKSLPVSDETRSKVYCHESKPINRVGRAPILRTPQFNRTECNQSKSSHSSPRIEILSWDDTGGLHVKVPKLSLNKKESPDSQNRVQCSFLREALTAEQPQPRFFESVKHKSTKSHRNESLGVVNDRLTGTQLVELSASKADCSKSEMSELEKYLRGIIPTEAAGKERCQTSGSRTSYQEDSPQISFLRKLLTGEMSTHAYREIDRRICEKKRREIK